MLPYVHVVALVVLPVPDLVTRIRILGTAAGWLPASPGPAWLRPDWTRLSWPCTVCPGCSASPGGLSAAGSSEAAVMLARVTIETTITGLYCLHQPDAVAQRQGENLRTLPLLLRFLRRRRDTSQRPAECIDRLNLGNSIWSGRDADEPATRTTTVSADMEALRTAGLPSVPAGALDPFLNFVADKIVVESAAAQACERRVDPAGPLTTRNPPERGSMASASPEVKQALKTLQGRIRQRPAEDETIVQTLRDMRSARAAELPLTSAHLAAMKAVESAIAADERFEHLAPAEDMIREFAADCATDSHADHAKAFMEHHGRDASERVCYFGVEFLRVDQATEVAGIRLLPLDDAEIPDTNPLFKADQSIASFAALPVTGTNDVLMAARARKLAEHALRVLRISFRQNSLGLNPQQLRFRLGTSHAFAEGGGGWKRHDDEAFPLELPPDMAPILAAPVAGLSPTAAKKGINEKALLAVEWLDRAVFTPDPLVATLFRFFALEALLGKVDDRLKNGPLALRQMTLSRIATGYFRHPDDTFLQYDQVRSHAVHGEIAPRVTPEQAGIFAWAVRDTLDQYLTVANERGFTKRKQLLDLLDGYPGRDELIAWIRERGSDEWIQYLDSITPARTRPPRPQAQMENKTQKAKHDLCLDKAGSCSLRPTRHHSRGRRDRSR